MPIFCIRANKSAGVLHSCKQAIRISSFQIETFLPGTADHHYQIHLLENRKGETCSDIPRYAPLIRANLSEFTAFKKIHSSVLMDYTFSLLFHNFGGLITAALILLFAAAMLHVIVRHRHAAEGNSVSAIAVATAVLLLVQGGFHICGVLGITPFTGLCFPLISKSYSSLIITGFLLGSTKINTPFENSDRKLKEMYWALSGTSACRSDITESAYHCILQ